MLETIVDDFAQSLDLLDRTRFYARLVELVNERHMSLKEALEGGDSPLDSLTLDSLKKVH